MSTHRFIDAVCVVVLLLTLLVTVLFMNGEALGIRVIVDEDAEGFDGPVYFTENDRNGAWDPAGATRIALKGDHAAVTGGGAYAYNGNVMITSAGKYVLSGTLDDGSIVVDTSSGAKVWLMLDGADIRCSGGACLDVEQADKVFLTLAEGSDNSMTVTGFSEENFAAGMDGAVFARDDLTINGSGTLTVTAEAENGIVGNDELVITDGTLRVTAAGDALHANDGLRIMRADVTLEAQDDGISVTGPESELYIESGTVSITSTDKGIAAGNSVRVLGGTLTLDAADKGIVSDNSICLEGGTVTIEAEDDGISAAGEVQLEGADIIIRAGDDGVHSDTAVLISAGSVQIPSCYEGIEAVTIEVTGGDITIYPEDDGLNANGGSGGFGGFGGFGGHGGGMPGMPGERPDRMDGQNRPEPPDGLEAGELPEMGEAPMAPQGLELPEGTAPESFEPPEWAERPELPEGAEAGSMPSAASEPADSAGEEQETWIHVSGGSITVINETARDADGLDSNGDIIISGGSIRVSLVNSGSNSALDYGSESGGVMEISGGDVIACGSYAMAEGFDSSSTQCSILYNLKRGAPAGTAISLEDSEGTVILSYEVPCSFSSLAISSPEMKLGETYTIVIGDSVEEITLDEVSASFGDAQSGSFGGPMNWGGMKFRPDS